jgi:hydrogenase maturation protease
MGTKIVGLGQRNAGDDAIGLLVLDGLKDHELPTETELYSLSEPSELTSVLQTNDSVWIIDAVVGPYPPGTILELSAQQWQQEQVQSISSHGLSLGQVLELTKELYPTTCTPQVLLLGVAIDPPQRYQIGLSKPIQKALSDMIQLILTKLEK